MKKQLSLYVCLFFGSALIAQQNIAVPVTFNLTFNQAPIQISEHHTPPESQPITIEVLKFYISKVELYNLDEKVFVEKNSFHLLDAVDKNSLTFQLNVPAQLSFTHLKFNIGIDSLTNVSGAFGGDLDPTNGMYWTWQSGFINFKLEGIAKNCPARHNRFQFHIGGYQPPFNSLQTIEFEISDRKNITIELAIDKIFKQINIEETYQVMSPNEKSVAFSKLIPSLFTVLK